MDQRNTGIEVTAMMSVAVARMMRMIFVDSDRGRDVAVEELLGSAWG